MQTLMVTLEESRVQMSGGSEGDDTAQDNGGWLGLGVNRPESYSLEESESISNSV